ncbi:MAG: hypothetical protein K2O08_04725, partial [Clostridia bacterium]|nr:hypothetical protein [Clostridia bacterium]
MDIRKKRKGLAAITIIMAMCCITLLLIFIASNPVLDKNAGNKTILESTASATLNSTYDSLYHGSTYKYTDYRKVEQTHSGAITDDTTTVYVDLTQPHGSQENPYVIDSIARWNAFAADMGDTTSGIKDNGNDQYFVLTKDLDFDGVTFNAVPLFCGTFYGLGHTLSNITCNANRNHFGVFKTTNRSAVFADLNVVDYSYSNAAMAGAIVGISYITSGLKSENKFLNCHTKGEVIRHSNGLDLKVGGIIGHADNSTVSSELLFYRCSAQLNGVCDEPNLPYEATYGPFTGQILNKMRTTILDCYGEVNVNIVSINKIGYYVGILPYVNTLSEPIRIENCVGSIRVDGNANVASGLIKGANSVIGMTNNTSAVKAPSVNIKNVYVKGEAEQNGTVYTLYPHTTSSTVNTYFGNPTFTATNVNYAGSGSNMFPLNSGSISTTKLNNASTKVASVDQLWANSKAETAFLNDIWTNKSAIGGTYTVETSPVRNVSFDTDDISAKFRHLTKTASGYSEDGVGVSDITCNYADGTALPTASGADSNHKFVGWTTDKSGESGSFTAMPSNMYGDITLYAVWDNPNATADFTLSNSFTKDSTDTIEYGTGDITLTATSNGPGMNSPAKSFKWYKDSATTAVATSNTCVLKNVKETGKYTLEYTLKDKDEPLWMHTEKLSKTQQVTITKGTLSVDTFSIDSATPAYFGKKLNNVKFSIQVKDKGNNTVA